MNTDGGCLANGEPIGASGLRQVYESVLQLRGDGRRASGPRRPGDGVHPRLRRARHLRLHRPQPVDAVSTRPFPTQPGEVTPAWLTAQLRGPALSTRRTRSAGFRSEPIGEGAGMLGVIARLQLQYEAEAGPISSVVVKCATPTVANRAVAMTFHMYEREVRFFRELADRLQEGVPACYAAEIDLESGDFVLVLEDSTGYRPGDQAAGCELADTAAVHRRDGPPAQRLVGRHRRSAAELGADGRRRAPPRRHGAGGRGDVGAVRRQLRSARRPGDHRRRLALPGGAARAAPAHGRGPADAHPR